MRNITIRDVEFLAFSLARQLMTFDESIPDYRTRYPGVLESCPACPFQSFSGRPLYRGLIAKTSTLFYFMLKNHPFQNGNKRIAITTLLVFLAINGKWLRVGLKEFYEFSTKIAASEAAARSESEREIRAFIKSHLVSARSPNPRNIGPSGKS
jgi:prophage maintenance system killer protein